MDIDNCATGGVLSDGATALVKRLDTYAELSPSGTGVHVICKGSLSGAGRGKWNGLDLEVYDTARYFTVTGRKLGDTDTVQDRTMLTRRLVSEIKQGAATKSVANTVERRLASALEKPHIKSLFNGDTSEYDNDQSKADLALCAKLAPYANGSRELLDQMFRRSQLFREKWDEKRGADTYGNITLAKVLSGDSPGLVIIHNGESTKESRRAGRFTVDSLWDRVMSFRENGDARGFHPGWNELERYYRPTLGSLSVLVGTPGSGKSTFIDALTFNMAKRHNWRITMASFESLPIERHINNLAQMYLQKPTYTFLAGCATDKEMDEAREELNEWFNFISPVDDDMTLETILQYVQDDIDDYGVNGFVLDPWTELDIQASGTSEVRSIERELRRVQQFTRAQEIHTWLLVHPTKTGDTFKQEAKGMRPTLYSASGAAHFRNKADFGLVIHRWDDDVVNLYVDKVRNDSSGGKGTVEFNFDLQRREYTEIIPDSW